MRRSILLFALLAAFSLHAEEAPKTPEPPKEEVESTLPAPMGDPILINNAYQSQFFKTFAALIAIVIGICVLMYLVRRMSHTRPLQMNNRKNIKILEKRHISPNTYLYHIQVGDKQFILSESKFQVRTVATLDWEEEKE